MRIAPEGWPFILPGWALAGVGVWAAARGSAWLWGPALILLALAAWLIVFFRDPRRDGPRGDRLIVAPADGRIVDVSVVHEAMYLKAEATRISIFMNVFDVHVNRYPVEGVVKYIHYNQGKFFNASTDKSSLENEQMSVGIDTGRYRVLVRQIAGLIARRIVTYSKLGETVRQGDRMGIIRFGSRVDVFLPLGSALRAKLGDLTTAGVSVLAELPK